MSKYIIIHGYSGNPKEHQWFIDIKNTLEKSGNYVVVPVMPNPNYPVQKQWNNTILSLLQKHKYKNIILIGHSLGGSTILRLAESGLKIKKAIFVSTPINSVEIKEIENFFSEPFNWKIIKKNISQSVIMHSTKDKCVPISHAKNISDKLDGDLHIYDDQNHGFDTLKTEEFLKYIT